LRYVAALCVLLTHLAWNFPAGRAKQFASELWAIGMPLFFTLSGFLMAYNYSAGFHSRYRSTLRQFFLARFARIYPIYFIGLLMWLAVVGNVGRDLSEQPRDTVIALLMNASLTQNWAYVPLYGGTAEPRAASYSHYWIAWSVSVECFFYLMFPLIIVPVARFITNARRAWLAGGAVYLAYLALDFALARTSSEPVLGSLRSVWELLQNPYVRLGEFVIGVMAGQAFVQAALRPLPARSWWLGSATLVASIPSLLYANHWIWSAANNSVVSRVAASNVLYAPLCAAIIYCLARFPTALQRFLGSRPLVLLGESSYCLYLLHPLVEHLFTTRLQGEGDLKIRRVLVFNHLMMLVVLHFLCFGLYRYAEMPLRSFVKRLLERRGKRESATSAGELIPIRAAA
jgi:peptidoglycan/LPS O-acetylase OafA/YrhL